MSLVATRKAAFLDRDGVINLDHGYVSQWADFEFVPGAMEAMRCLQAAGFALVVVTNQSGIARGMYTQADYERLTAQMRQALAVQGVVLDGVFHCPHLPGAAVAQWALDCDCRKPAPGLILQAAEALALSVADSILFGDKPSDLEAAQRAGVGRAYLVAKNGVIDPSQPVKADFASLANAVQTLLEPGHC